MSSYVALDSSWMILGAVPDFTMPTDSIIASTPTPRPRRAPGYDYYPHLYASARAELGNFSPFRGAASFDVDPGLPFMICRPSQSDSSTLNSYSIYHV